MLDDVYENLVVVGATNRPQVLDPSLRRHGRLHKEVSMLDDVLENLAVLGATNRPQVLDPSLRRHGRLDKEVSMLDDVHKKPSGSWCY